MIKNGQVVTRDLYQVPCQLRDYSRMRCPKPLPGKSAVPWQASHKIMLYSWVSYFRALSKRWYAKHDC